PMLMYHGTRRGGFNTFDTEGVGKTSDTGAFFTNSRRVAASYAGGTWEDINAGELTGAKIVENPDLVDSIEIEEGFVVTLGDSVKTTRFFEERWEAESFAEGDESAAITPGYGLYVDG